MIVFPFVLLAAIAVPQTTPAPSPAPAGSEASDPCGGDTRLLATLNRPTIGFSVCAVPRGAIVLEEGYQNTAGASSVTAVFPQGFERFGVADRFELDVIGPNQNRLRSGGIVTTGASDGGLGFKYELPPSGRFTYGIDGLFTTPTGAGSFSLGAPAQTVDVDVAYQLSPAMGLGTTLAQSAAAGVSSSGAIVRYGDFMPSIVGTVQLPSASQFYFETVAQTRSSPDGGGLIFSDFGLQKLLGPYLELDAEYGFAVAPVARRFHYLGLGTGIRLR